MKSYDIIIIGSGSGGLTVAFTAIGFGKKVLVIDKDKPGGECTWSGCVPSKALIHKAKEFYHTQKTLKDLSLSQGYTYNEKLVYDTKEALDHVKSVREHIYSEEDPDTLAENGIEYIQGFASFIGKNKVRVNDLHFYGKKIFICTGSSPFIPSIKGLENVDYYTNETLFELDRFPKSMTILGAGPIGVELSQALNRLGVHVDLIEMMPRILYREEEVLTQKLTNLLIGEGVSIHVNTKAISCSAKDDDIHLTISDGKTTNTIINKSILIAVGRQPNIKDLNLEAAGIKYSDKGILVNQFLQTSNKSVYAVGDVTGNYNFSHMANAEGIKAVQNAVLPIKRKMDYNHVPSVTFTEPELARTGYTEAEVKDLYKSIRVYNVPFNTLDRSKTEGFTDEYFKLILNQKGKILGASILSDRAGELISELQVVKSLGKNYSVLGKIIHPYPTYSEVFSKLGKKVMIDNLFNHPIVKLFKRK